MILPTSFYQHDDVVSISKDLLGKKICTTFDGTLTSGIIVETEAYRAPDDRACHANGNKRTERNKSMFLEGGTLYVYICYGLHTMINIVTSQEGKAHAVLIRAIEPKEGIERMLDRRNHKTLKADLVNGPGKSARALGVEKIHDGRILTHKSSNIWIEETDTRISEDEMHIGPRVGLSLHVGPDAHRPWRFYIKDSKWVSGPRIVRYPHIPKS